MGCAASTSQVSVEDFHACYRLGVKLGRGGFAQVRAATPVKATGSQIEDVAVKIIDLRGKSDSKKERERLENKSMNEASCWKSARGFKHIVNLKEVFHSTDFCYFVMEKCASSIQQHMESLTELDERSVARIVSQMFLGVGHMHRVGIVHRDVKPTNFMVGGFDGVTVKLCDFGMSIRLPSHARFLKGRGGTAPFMCPEMITFEVFNDRADVWSMGVIVYAFLFGEFPYVPVIKHPEAMKQAVSEGKPPKFRPAVLASGSEEERSSTAVSFVRKLLDRDPDGRPSANDALNLAYLDSSRDATIFQDATRGRKHIIRSNLPSLRPALRGAKKAGVFDSLDNEWDSSVDDALSTLRVEKHGKPLPDAISGPKARKRSHSSKKRVENYDSSTLSTASPGSSPVPRSASDWSDSCRLNFSSRTREFSHTPSCLTNTKAEV
jgi:serine/threonine protein kinase